jgi:twinkle protein
MNTLPENIDFQTWYDMMEPAVMIRPAKDIVRQAIEMLETEQPPPVVMPWGKLKDMFSFRPSEVTVYAGQNGSGKSMITGMIALQLMAQKRNVLIASFEMKPTTTLQRMVRQFTGTQFPTADDYRNFAAWGGNYLWFYDRQGEVSREQIIGVGNYAARELKMNDFFIDSLMKCVKGEDDYNAQKDFVSDCTNLARDTDLHIHLVHHIRKGATDEAMPQKVDMKGSGSIADQVDNVWMMWRNKKKERLIEAGQAVDPAEPDAMLLCEKQRNGEHEPRLRLWYDRTSQQFLEKPGANPYRFDPDF